MGAPRRAACSMPRLPSSTVGGPLRSRWWVSPGSARPVCSLSSRLALTRVGTSFSTGRHRSSSEICRSGCSSMRSTSTSRGLSRVASRPSTTTFVASSRTSSRRCLGSRQPAQLCSSTSATAATARCASCSNDSPRPKPLVLVLDDLHWADSASVELLGALLRRPPAAAVLVALAVRPRQAPERVAAALERAQRAGTLVRVEVGALTRGEARELLGEAVDGAAATALYEESGGNPFYLEQLARSLARRAQRQAFLSSRPRISTCRRRLLPRWPRSSLFCRTPRASCWRAERWPATRSSPSLRRPPRRPPRRRRSRRWTSC